MKINLHANQAALDKNAVDILEESIMNACDEQSLLRALMGNTSDHIYFKDIQSRFIAMSTAQAHRFGLNDPKEAIGKTDFDFFSKEHARQAFVDEQTIMQTGCSIVGIEEKETWPDGSETWVSTTKMPLYDNEGKIIGTFGVSRDITSQKKAAQIIRQSEVRFRSLFDNMLDGFAYCEMIFENGVPQDFLYLDVNDAFGKLTGLKNVIGKKVSEVIPGIRESNPELFEIYGRTASTGESAKFESYLEALGIWLSVSAYCPEKGYFVAVFDNITERKHSEEKINRLNRVYAVMSETNQLIVRARDRQKLFEEACRIGAEVGKFKLVWIGIVDQARHRVNPVAHAGLSEGYLEQLNISLTSDIPEGLGPTGTALREQRWMVCNDIAHDERMLPWRTEALKRSFRSSAAFPIRRGDRVYGVINFYSSDIGFFDEKEIALLDELSSDISFGIEKLELEEQRIQSERERQQLITAIEQSAEAIVMTDSHGMIQYVNPAFERMTGYSQHEVVGHNPRILSSGKHDKQFYAEMWNTITSGKTWNGKLVNKKKDGSLLTEEAVISPVLNKQGAIVNYVAVKRDITNELSLQAQLIQAQKLEGLGTLASGIAHDFNNILGIIMGNSILMKRVDPNQEVFSKSLEAITNASQRGASLVKQLLTFARKSETRLESVQINDTIVEIKKLLQETFPKTVVITTGLQANLPPIAADATQIHQVLLNLCVNARDAMPKGGTLFISTQALEQKTIIERHPSAEQRTYVEIEVTDTGTGMDEATKQRIFDPFFTTKDIGKGTGLGLALVYGIVKEQNGFIEVDSEPGIGTTFRVILPVKEQIPAAKTAPVKKLQEIPCGTETLLLIEDEDLLRGLLKTVLEAKGYTVLEAVDGEAGVTAFQNNKEKIAAIITDLGLPRLGGEEVFKKIRLIDPMAKIIIASGFIEPNIKSEIFKAGAKRFIQKPYVPNEVLEIIREVIDSKE